MATPLRLTFWTRFVEVAVLAVAVCFSLGASSPSSRLSDLDHQVMCQCGCAQLLGECDHVGCPDRDRELAELTADISSGMNDKEIFAAFTAKYGAVVLAAPTTHGFDLVAWIAPFAVFAAALLGTILLVRHWTVGKTPLTAQASTPELDAMREQIRRETDSNNDGGD